MIIHMILNIQVFNAKVEKIEQATKPKRNMISIKKLHNSEIITYDNAILTSFNDTSVSLELEVERV